MCLSKRNREMTKLDLAYESARTGVYVSTIFELRSYQEHIGDFFLVRTPPLLEDFISRYIMWARNHDNFGRENKRPVVWSEKS